MNESDIVRQESGIAPTTLGKLVRLFETTAGIDAVWLYGSRARGDHRHDSDIDLMVDAARMSGADRAGPAL